MPSEKSGIFIELIKNYTLIFCLLIDVTHEAVRSTMYKNKTGMILTVSLLEKFHADVEKTLLKFSLKEFCSPSLLL